VINAVARNQRAPERNIKYFNLQLGRTIRIPDPSSPSIVIVIVFKSRTTRVHSDGHRPASRKGTRSRTSPADDSVETLGAERGCCPISRNSSASRSFRVKKSSKTAAEREEISRARTESAAPKMYRCASNFEGILSRIRREFRRYRNIPARCIAGDAAG